MDFLRKILGILPEWDGRDRRSSLRAKCDFDLEVSGSGVQYQGRALDASPKGVRVRVRGQWPGRSIKHGLGVDLKMTEPLADVQIQVVRGKITWVKRLDNDLFLLAISFDDTIDNLRHSWVKPVLMKGLAARVRQQRGYVRVPCVLNVEFLLHGKLFGGTLKDLSIQGGRLEAVQPFSQGSHIDLRLGPLHDLPRTSVRAVVRRAYLQPQAIYYGLTFMADDATRKLLLRYVRALLDPPSGPAI